MQSRRPWMTPLKPHMLRACFDWLLENDLTPYLIVNLKFGKPDGWLLPEFLRSEGTETLSFDCSPEAVDDFLITAQSVGFEASFEGEDCEILIPMDAVVGLYAKENGEGIAFEGPEKRKLLPLGWQPSKAGGTESGQSSGSQPFKLL